MNPLFHYDLAKLHVEEIEKEVESTQRYRCKRRDRLAGLWLVRQVICHFQSLLAKLVSNLHHETSLPTDLLESDTKA